MSERCLAWVPHRYDKQTVTQCSKGAIGQVDDIDFCGQHLKVLAAQVAAGSLPEDAAYAARYDKERMTFHERAEVPPPHLAFTLYRMYDADDDLLYIGISGRGLRRFSEHRSNKAWWINVATIRVEHYDSAEMAGGAEAEAIWNEKPLHNVRHNAPGVRETSEIPA